MSDSIDNTSTFVHQLNEDGSKNPKYVDVLDEDKPIAGQKFTCISFISPEKILKKREIFQFEEFLKQWDLAKSMEKYSQFLSFVAYKYGLDMNILTNDLDGFLKEEKDTLFKTTTLLDEYNNFLDANEKKLEDKFNKDHSFQTSTRGIKVRGSFPSQGEAELRCQMLREQDPNHDVYVGPVGVWMPFHPEAYKTGRVEYLQDELNQLMHEKNKNESSARNDFEARIKEAKEKAIQDNVAKAENSGNVLTQKLNEEGDLVNIANTNTHIDSLTDEHKDENIIVADIRKELFENENVVLDTNTDHGLSNLTENNKKN